MTSRSTASLPSDVIAPGHPVIARGLITDRDGVWLVVLPAWPNEPWDRPGGVIGTGESPASGQTRAIGEELGVTLMVQELLLAGVVARRG